MKIRDAITTAIRDRNYILMTQVVDMLRLKYGMTCEGMREYFEKVSGQAIEPPRWDEWMQECDAISSYL